MLAMERIHADLFFSCRPSGCIPIWQRKSLHSYKELLVIVISSIWYAVCSKDPLNMYPALRTISIERRGCNFSPMQRQITLGKLMRGYSSFLNRKMLLRESKQASANLSRVTPFRVMWADNVLEKEAGSPCRMVVTFRDRFANSLAVSPLLMIKISSSSLYRSMPCCIPWFIAWLFANQIK